MKGPLCDLAVATSVAELTLYVVVDHRRYCDRACAFKFVIFKPSMIDESTFAVCNPQPAGQAVMVNLADVRAIYLVNVKVGYLDGLKDLFGKYTQGKSLILPFSYTLFEEVTSYKAYSSPILKVNLIFHEIVFDIERIEGMRLVTPSSSLLISFRRLEHSNEDARSQSFKILFSIYLRFKRT